MAHTAPKRALPLTVLPAFIARKAKQLAFHLLRRKLFTSP